MTTPVERGKLAIKIAAAAMEREPTQHRLNEYRARVSELHAFLLVAAHLKEEEQKT